MRRSLSCGVLVALPMLGAGCAGASSRSLAPQTTVAIGNAPAEPVPATAAPAQGEATAASGEAAAYEDAAPTGGPGWLGVELESNGKIAALQPPGAPDPDPGVLVSRVVPGSPAERAGLLPGDVIQRLDNVTMTTPADVVAFVSARGTATRIAVMLKRMSADRLLAVTLADRPSEDQVFRMGFVDRPAPAFVALQAAKGSVTPTLAAQRGQVVVLEFWKPFCVPCAALVPHMNQWHAHYAARGLRVIGISATDVSATAAAATDLGMDYAVLADAMDGAPTSRAYNVRATPTVFVIDRTGTVRDVMIGYDAPRLAKLDKLVERLLAER